MIFSFSGACATQPAPKDEIPSAKGYYERGLEVLEGHRVLLFLSDVDYARATGLFQEVIDNYPYSEYASLAELKIADIYFDRGRFEEAGSYYQDFVELHPTSPRLDYALFRNGLSAFERLGAPDQDQTLTAEAISQFKFLLERYPQSEYRQRAEEMLARSQNHLAERDMLVGDFYFRRGDYFAAQRRYLDALEQNPEYGRSLETMLRLATAFRHSGYHRRAEDLLLQILSSDPDDRVRDGAEQLLFELGVGLTDDDRYALPRSCSTHLNPACPPLQPLVK